MKVLSFHDRAAKNFYSRTLRCIGQSLEALDLKALELRCQGSAYSIQGWQKGPLFSVDLERRYTPDDIKKLETEGRKKRHGLPRRAYLLSLSQLLRTAGTYVDQIEGRLLRVSWQNQSDKIQSVTIQYEAKSEPSRNDKEERQLSTIDEICIHIYKQRKKIPASFDK
ncbi:MAG TPA: hypothetical protein VGR30_10130 [Candidatus Binatia bacterium]|jgi:hypothetical protein|nr:hypothetical protein [Candidatus Binatia bacterium]